MRKPFPWYMEERDGWYVRVNGQRHFLGKHPEGMKKPAKSKKTGRWNWPEDIDLAFRRLLSGGSAQEATSDRVVDVLDAFIVWCQEHRAGLTASRYEELCQDFVKASDGGLKFGLLPVLNLSPKHVTAWLRQRPSWGPTTKRNAITALSRAFNWACKNFNLARNPIKGMEKPEASTRTGIVTPEEFEKLLAAIPDQRFRDLLIVSYDSGGRPFEVKELEARHCQLEKQRAVIPKGEAKGKKHPRTVYFPTERSMEIVRRRADKFPDGPLFRNRLGNKWTSQAVKCRLEDLDHILGRRVRHYDLRHAWVTRKLVAGVDSHIVAKLAGHRDSGMLDRVYSHAADDFEYMLKNAKKDL